MNKPPVRSRARSVAALALPQSNFDLAQLRLSIEYRDPEDLKPARRGVRKHDECHLARIGASITEHGFLLPVLVDQSARIVVGHGRWAAAKKLNHGKIPVVETSHLTEEQIRIFRICDNKLAEASEWDVDALKLELKDLSELSLATELNLDLTGFSTAEIDNLLTSDPAADREESQDLLPQAHSLVISRPGDVWHLGPHRLICGNSVEQRTYQDLLGGDRAHMVFSDPPYNVPARTISGNGRKQHEDFAMASGEMSRAEFTDFLATSFTLLTQHSVDGSIHFQCMDHRHMREMLDAGYSSYSELKNLVVWKKHSAGMGSFYRSQHELIFVWKNGAAAHINNFGLGETGRHRSNVWEYRGNAGFHILLQLAFASNWFTIDPSFNGPIWSVSIEVLIYFVFLLYLKRLGLHLGAAIGLAVAGGALAIITDNLVAQCLCLFFVGVVIAIVAPEIRRLLPLAAAGVIATLLLGVVLYWLGKAYLNYALAAYVGCPAILTLFVALDREIRPLRANWHWIGLSTYSTYLWHLPLIMALKIVWGDWIPAFLPNPLVLCLWVAVVAVIGVVSYRHFEAPMQDRLRRTLRSRPRSSQALG